MVMEKSEGLISILGFGNELYIVKLGEQHSQSRPNKYRVISNQNPNGMLHQK
jgi:hypothetical protein